jgi:hypothetical protein
MFRSPMRAHGHQQCHEDAARRGVVMSARRSPVALLLAFVATACAAGSPPSADLDVGSTPPASAGAADSLAPSAVGSGSEPPSAPGRSGAASLDGCSLLTDEEILAAIGHPVEFRTHEYYEFDAGCIWNLEPASEYLALDLGVMLTGGREFYENIVGGLEAAEPLSGIGDDAIVSPEGEILAVSDDMVVYFQYTGERPTSDAIRGLVATVVTRLP